MWKQVSPRWPVNNLYKHLKGGPINTNIGVKIFRNALNIKYPSRGLLTSNHKNKLFNQETNHGPYHILSRECSEISSTPAAEYTSEMASYIKTTESDPRNHDERHLGRIYTMPGK